MARVASAASTKKGDRRGTGTSERPRPGTITGMAYDLLQANKGQPVSLDRLDGHGRVIADLIDIWGLDIRSVKRWSEEQRHRAGRKKVDYVLVGEWFGRVYLDYTEAAKLNQRDT